MVHAYDRIDAWKRARRAAGALLLAVDFDGTLAPIVPRPEDAAIDDAARAALRAAAARPDTHVAIVSGRGLADVRERVGLGELYYAGNHGMEIEGPDLRELHPEAEAARPAVAACARALERALGDLDGVQVEDKGLTLSVHYRRATAPDAADRVRRAVAETCTDPRLRTTEGKMVVEVRPAVDWDKGRATRFLLDALSADAAATPAIFLGDDRTDEDAFRALRSDDAAAAGSLRDAVLVAERPPDDTAATCWVRSPAEVAVLLSALAESP